MKGPRKEATIDLYRHLIVRTPPRGAPALAREILDAPGAGGRLFGVFTSQIGLSANHLVVIARGEGEGSVPGGAQVARDEIWEADPRPVPGETFPETDGVLSHRWFDVADADWPRFRELSLGAWDNFEGAHATRVIGFWRARAAPAPGLKRVWLMAWYADLAAWEGSRWYLNPDRPDAKQAYDNFRERGRLTVDTAVSLLRRIV